MIKIITGFRGEQYYVISPEEAHKAYYLFNNPEARTVFENGVALIGKNIQGIEPAWNETMGWNPSHKIDDDDWNEINRTGTGKKLKDQLEEGRRIAKIAELKPEVLKLKMTEVVTMLLE